jgi:TonB family protein
MYRTFRAVGVIVAALVCAGVSGSHTSGHKRGKTSGTENNASALFARAKAMADIMAPDTPPYALRIRVSGLGQLSGYPVGIYSMQFASPSEFRQDAAFGAAHFSSGAHGDPANLWRIEDGSRHSLLEDVFMRSMAYAYSPTALELTGANAHIKHRDDQGASLECVQEQDLFTKKVCFDSSTGALRAVLDDPGFVYQYNDFRPWGNHLVPAKILVFADNSLILRGAIEFLTGLSDKQARPSNFIPPAGATGLRSRKSCTVEQARLISSAIPSFPRGAGPPGGSGSVLFWGEIDRTGQIQDAIVMQSAGTAYDQAALRAMKQWRYAPATTCGEPVAMPGAFRIAFR